MKENIDESNFNNIKNVYMINDCFQIRNQNESLEHNSKTILIAQSINEKDHSINLNKQKLEDLFEFFIQSICFIYLILISILIYKTQVTKHF